MVIVRPDGSFILDGGDPNFATVQDLGANDPTNAILDPDPTKPLSQFILEKFGIPFQPHALGRVLGGILPGYDVRNQDAATMLRLSLAVEIKSAGNSTDPAGVGEFAEIEIDGFGIARFYIVGEEAAQNLDIRYCVPTSQIVNPADLVIVRGYDTPPSRELRTSFDGMKNAEIYEYEECAVESCDERAVGRFASVSYDDPLLDQTFLDDILNSYELQAFETLLGYVTDLDLPSGADPDSLDYRPGLKVTFGDSTAEYIAIDADIFNSSVVDLGIAGGLNTDGGQILSGGLNTFGGSSSFGNIAGFSGRSVSTPVRYGSRANTSNSTTITITSVDPRTGECQQEATSIAGGKIVIPASRFLRENKFGNLESDFIGVKEVIFSGRKIIRLVFIGGFTIQIFVKPNKQLIRLEQGKNWTWTVDADNNVELEFFSLLEDDFTATVASIYNGNVGEANVFRLNSSTPNAAAEATGLAALQGMVANIGDRLGYLAINNELCIVVDRKRPSVDVFDPNGNAGEIARQFITFVADPNSAGVEHNGQVIPGVRRQAGIRFTPIVIVDEPAPIAYAANAPLQSIDAQTGTPGSTILPAQGIIDQADGIRDADPITVQDFDESEIQVLQDNTNGSTIDITLPFCNAEECLDIAVNLLALQQATVNSQSIALGPDSQPRLGQVLPDGSIINEINYSYQDSSQYLITVTAGPKYLTAGSFQTSTYQLETEDVTREGTVVQDKGNGAAYVVRVEGFGEITALSMTLEEISVGDKVSVRIYNNPVEKR